MENASKALIIAGAILISILLIGIGMFVYTSSQGTISTAVSSMSAQEKEMYNQKFKQYEGRQSGAAVRALISAVQSNNSTVETGGNTITVDGNAGFTETTTGSNIPTTAYYDVTCALNTNGTGLIGTITINNVSAGS